jgi:dipeptidyl aminopeptidase/acylaminoacyl peptidase
MNYDGTNVIRRTNNPARDFSPTWSPDGTRIAFWSDRDGNFEIYVMNSTGSGLTRLTNNPADDYDPAFSPDSKKIAFWSGTGNSHDVYMMNVDGTNVTNLTNGAGDNAEPTWSPDGTKIVFVSNRFGNYGICVMNAADGAGVTCRTNRSEGGPDWQPFTPIIVNLDAHSVSSATPTGQGNVSVYLAPGMYRVKPVGVAGGGRFTAWSAWPTNLNCDIIGENCVRGFENEFEFRSASIPFTMLWDGKRYATALQALSHAKIATFTLTVDEVVRFGLNDCPGCLGDNRGGNSLEITAIPPVSGCLSLRDAPVANRIVILTQTGEVAQRTMTNTNGCYEFARVGAGKSFNVTILGPVVP